MAISPYGPGRGSGMLDLALAALAGGSVAFATFAMPDTLFARIIVASNLPELLAAARPPLGDTARWAAIAAAGAATALLVWVLLRALDRVPAGRRSPATPFADGEPAADAPRVRRADAHPDAPTRRPLRAGRELGEPSEEPPPPPEDTLDLVEEAPEERFADLVPQPLPGFLVPQETEEAAEAGRSAEARESLEALSDQLPAAAAEGGGKSIGDLMQRLESGLSRREPSPSRQAAVPPVAAARPEPPEAPAPPKPSRTPLDLSPPEPPPSEAAPPAEDRVGHRLRGAINDLNKLSGLG